MKNNWILVAYYTFNYKKVFEKYLSSSLKQLKNNYYIKEIKKDDGWKINTNYKPIFISNCLKKFKNKDIVYLDVDATINCHPILFDKLPKEYDIAIHYLNWGVHYGYQHNKKELLSGTIYFRNNDIINNYIIPKWIKNIDHYYWEQKSLDYALKTNVNIYELPRNYCYINSTPKGLPAIQIINPIITHFQAGRKNKK